MSVLQNDQRAAKRGDWVWTILIDLTQESASKANGGALGLVFG